ncbi:MAG: cytochrome c [Candidatus Glassbacteria bacterium]|nr:cytochrome c [Candidatus Glassbacteria bacterium]
MSEWKDRLIYPPLYLIFLLAAVFFVYKAFTTGLEHGEYVGKYEPHEEGGPAPLEEETYDLALLLESTDELTGQGEELYNINCASCHGMDGLGKGPKGPGLNPPPRNFTSEQFKQGAGTLQIYQTLNKGVPGSSMTSFSFLNPGELMALAHYVRTFIPAPPPDPPALVQELAPGAGGAAAQLPAVPGDSSGADSAAGAADTVAAKGPSLPVEFAVEQMLSGRMDPARPLQDSPQVFANRCATCHGPLGEGAVVERTFPQLGVIYAGTKPLSMTGAKVIADYRAFASFISAGIPGQPGHRFPDLSADEIQALYETINRAAGN